MKSGGKPACHRKAESREEAETLCKMEPLVVVVRNLLTRHAADGGQGE